MQRIGYKSADIVEPKGCQHNFLDPGSSLAGRLQHPHERVRRIDFVVAVGSEQHQVPHVQIGNQALQKVKSCRVQPLQIIEEQRKRVLRPGERAEEPPEHQLEAVPLVLRRQVWNGRLFPDKELDLRDEIDDELAIRTQSLLKSVPPLAYLRFA